MAVFSGSVTLASLLRVGDVTLPSAAVSSPLAAERAVAFPCAVGLHSNAA